MFRNAPMRLDSESVCSILNRRSVGIATCFSYSHLSLNYRVWIDPFLRELNASFTRFLRTLSADNNKNKKLSRYNFEKKDI